MASNPNQPPGKLGLDPGPRARRRSGINWKCISLSFLTVVSLLGLFLVFKVVKLALMPQDEGTRTKLYQDLTVPFTPRDVVQPLVDSKETFDVVVTVWLRQDVAQANVNEGGPILAEKAIYSDTIFRGLRLEDKNIKTAVELVIPTEIFKSPEIWTYDLRASFVLIPNSPSPLDYAVNYTSWIPTAVNYPPMRSWPAGYSPSLADQIVDSYGALLPLLVLKTVNSSCPPSPRTEIKDSDKANDYLDEIFDLDDPVQTKTITSRLAGQLFTSTTRKPVLDTHPHIITRSHLRVVDMTRLFNRMEYEKAHRELRDLSCGQNLNGLLDWRFCWRHFETNQNSETRIKLRKKDPETGKNLTEWAYAPYLSLSENARGPLDLVKVPINREECQSTTLENNTESKSQNVDENFVNITWSIVFSGSTPNNLLIDDRMGLAASVYIDKTLDTDKDKEKAQNNLDFINGLAGHRTNEDTHPRRVLALAVLYIVISFFEALLEMYYWFSCTSTVGISTFGSILVGGASLIQTVVRMVVESRKESFRLGWGWFFGVLVVEIPFALTPLFMLKAALRAELRWYAKWIPILRIAHPTHSERASERLEARTSWLYKAIAFAALAFIFTYYPDLRFLSSENYGSVGATKQVSDLSTKLTRILISPSITLGRVLQLALNYRAKSFAGMYRISAPLSLIAMTFALGKALPHVVGNLHTAGGVTVPMLINFVYAGVVTWQAVRYAPVASQEEDESTK